MGLLRRTVRQVISTTSGSGRSWIRGPPAPAWFVSLLYALFASLGFWLAVWETGDRALDRLRTVRAEGNGVEVYDFIIVGGGTAGLVLASRLSENPDWKILVLEVGGEPNPLQRVPAFVINMINRPQTDWRYKTTRQKNSCLAADNQQMLWPAGKSLGGSSNLNYMIYLRGNPKDFDNWAEVTDDPTWKYENLLKYFKKVEDFDSEWFSESHHGRGGPLHVQKPDYQGLAHEYIRAAKDIGYDNVDLNGNYTEGFDTIYYAMKDGLRLGTYWSYFQSARKRSNLVIYKYAHVHKILFRDKSTEAHGVVYDRHGSRRQAFARKEIILSAGAMQSPKILMLSGIGPREHLENLQVPVILDHPRVGKNLQDHVWTIIPFEIKSSAVAVPNIDRDMTPRTLYDHITKGQGFLGTNGITATGLVASSFAKARGEPDWPDIQYFLLGMGFHRGYPAEFSRAFDLKREYTDEIYKDSIGKNIFQQLIVLTRPKSRGVIKLPSNDPYAVPIIDPKYFDHEDDMKILVEGMQQSVFLLENSATFSKLGTSLVKAVPRGCESLPFRSDEFFECFARTFTLTLFHPVGTCAMGKKDLRTAVVDSELRVIGVKGLRVIDASVMPFVPVSNTQAPTIMIAEKGADLIKKAWTDEASHGAQDSVPSNKVASTPPRPTAPAPAPPETTPMEEKQTEESETTINSYAEFPEYYDALDEVNRVPSSSPPPPAPPPRPKVDTERTPVELKPTLTSNASKYDYDYESLNLDVRKLNTLRSSHQRRRAAA